MRALSKAPGLALWLVLTMAGAALAQAGPARRPQTLPPSGAVKGELVTEAPSAPDGARYDCYAIDTNPGSRWTIRAQSAAFAPEIWVARGSLCDAASPAHRQVADATGAAELSFNSPGGRYLVMVRGAGAGKVGRYTLLVDGTRSPSAAAAAPVTPDQAAAQRVALMNRQVAERRAVVAAEEAAAKAAEDARRRAERARLAAARQAEREREAARSQAIGAFMGALSMVANEYNAQVQADNARIEAENARMFAENAERIRQRDAAQQRAITEQRTQAQSQQSQQNAAMLAQDRAFMVQEARRAAAAGETARNQQMLAALAQNNADARRVGVEAQVNQGTERLLASGQTVNPYGSRAATPASPQQQAAAQQAQAAERARDEAERRAAAQAEERRRAEVEQQRQRQLADQLKREEDQRRAAEQERVRVAAEKRAADARAAALAQAQTRADAIQVVTWRSESGFGVGDVGTEQIMHGLRVRVEFRRAFDDNKNMDVYAVIYNPSDQRFCGAQRLTDDGPPTEDHAAFQAPAGGTKQWRESMPIGVKQVYILVRKWTC